jgi:hypothetical protein
MTDDEFSDTTHSTSLAHRQTRAPPNHRRLSDLDGPSLTVGVMLGMMLGVFITSAFLAGVVALV